MNKKINLGIGLLLAGACFASSAQAGGFNRGNANLDLLYGDGALGITSGVTFVAPDRSYTNARGAVIVGGAAAAFSQDNITFGNDYTVPYASIGGRIIGDLSCVASYSEPYGADVSMDGSMAYHLAAQSLDTKEYGFTCGYGFDLSKGRLSLIGGVFREEIDYHQARNFNASFGNVGDSAINVSSGDWGYRLGVGYEIPEIALKTTLMYRSKTEHEATGAYTNTPFAQLTTLALIGQGVAPGLAAAQAAALYGTNTEASAFATATLPQSLEFTAQTGVAPGWLVFGTVKWTDWSVLQKLSLTEGIANQEFSTTYFEFKDGWTITGGVGHKFNEKLGGSLSLTWDRGVSTGWDSLYDTWTVAGGLAYDVTEKFQIRGGAALFYLEGGEKSKTSSAVDYTATSPGEWGYGLSLAATIKF